MKIKTFLLLGLLLAVASCTKSSSYSSTIDFSNNQWQKKDPQLFDFTIEDDSKLYDMVFSISHVYDYQFASIPLSFTWIKPDGTTETIPLDFKIKDKNGKDLGECAGDICDLNYPLKENVKLQKGKHQIKVSHSFQFDYLPNIINIGFKVIKLNK